MSRVAILGCGPTGLLCAYAAEQNGHEPTVISIRKKSQIPGSQHLHGPVPGLTPQYPEGTIQFIRIGTARGYAEKVYGDPDRETGWDNYFQVYPSWNALKVYDRLWDRYWEQIVEQEVDPDFAYDVSHEMDFDMVISTIPGWVICEEPKHTFDKVGYVIQQLPMPEGKEEVVVYNGIPGDPWYRWSILGGKCSIEYPHLPLPGTMHDHPRDYAIGYKALGNDCDCWPGITRIGRWAEWTHGVTMHSSYLKASKILEEL